MASSTAHSLLFLLFLLWVFHSVTLRSIESTPNQSANRLRLRKASPNLHNRAIPTAHSTIRPASRLAPPEMPMLLNIGRANNTAAKATTLRAKLLAAKILAAYRG